MAIARSENMSRIKSANTKPEIRLRQALWKSGIRYRLHLPILGIRPDLVIQYAKLVIFVDGCQWHGCPKHYVSPRTKVEFWGQKLLTNVQRDVRQTQILKEAGWRVIRIWEHEIYEDLEFALHKINQLTNCNDTKPEEQWRVYGVEVIDADNDLENRFMLLLEMPETRKTVQQKRSTSKWSRKNA